MNQQLDSRFSRMSFARRLVILGAGLILLFTVVAPELTQSLSFLQRIIYWSLHIGLGLVTAVSVALLLGRWLTNLYDWRLIVLSGLGGLILFAPIAYGLEFVFPLASDGADFDWSDRIAQSSVFAAVLIEALELAPSYLTAWALINFEPLSPSWNPFLNRSSAGSKPITTPVLQNEETDEPAASLPVDTRQLDQNDFEIQRSTLIETMLDRLPPIVGRQLVSISSDLHYLKVLTRKGEAMILGSLQEIEDAFGNAGLRVHRSHWVYLDAVVSLRKSGKGWHLEMTDGPSIPVSRRKKAEVTKFLGVDFKCTSATV